MQSAVDLSRPGMPAGLKTGHRTRRRSLSWILLAATLVSLLALLPLGFIVWVAVQTGWQTVSALIFRPRVGELLINTILLVALAVPISIVLSVALAWLTERSDLPGARLWAWLSVAPLAVPAFVHTYAWISLVPGLHGLWAGVLVSVIAYFPFLYLPIAAALRRLDPALEDAAAALGLGPWRVFATRRAAAAETGHLRRLAAGRPASARRIRPLRLHPLRHLHHGDRRPVPVDLQRTGGQHAGRGAGGLLLRAARRWKCWCAASERYARVGSGAARQQLRTQLGRATLPCLALPAITALLALGVPFVTISRWLVAGGADVWRLDEIGLALGQTLVLALAGALLATHCRHANGVAVDPRARAACSGLLEGCNYIVGSLPGVVIALALVTVTVRIALPLYQTIVTILFAYALMFLPRALVSLRASIAQAPVELERAAGSLGRPPLAGAVVDDHAPVGARVRGRHGAGGAGHHQRTDRHPDAGAQRHPHAGDGILVAIAARSTMPRPRPYALIMVAMSLPLTWLLYVQSQRMAGR